jgi:hypothetical protein
VWIADSPILSEAAIRKVGLRANSGPGDTARNEIEPRRRDVSPVTEFVEWLAGTHMCACGAKYKVTVTKTPADRVSCEKCGIVMDHPVRKSLLAYERIQ